MKPSLIGFGAFKIGRNVGIKYPDRYDLPDQAATDRLLNGVLDLGISYIDTAPAYGLSEERIGRCIAHRRDEFYLSTKVGETFEDGQSTHDYSAGAVRESVERSLRRLRTDRIDLVFIHSNGQDIEILEQTDAVPALLTLRDQGKIASVGLSGYTEEGLAAALSWADALMVEYHLDNRSMETVMAQAGERGIAVMVKKGLASGRLQAQAAVGFVLSNPHVTSLVLGGLNLDHLRDNVKAAERARRDMAEGRS